MSKNNIESIENSPINVIKSDTHTLISTFVEEERFPVIEPDGNAIPGIFEIVPAYTKHSLFIGDFEDNSYHGLNQIKESLMSSGFDDLLETHISSYGGSVNEAIELVNIINTKFSNTTCYLNYGYSMGALLFLVFKERIIYENSDFMIHNWSGGFFGKSSDINSQFEHTSKHLKKIFKNLIKPYFSKKEIKKIENGKEVWLSAYDMLKRGIATGILKDGDYYSSEDYLKKFKKSGKIKKSWKESEDKVEETEDIVND